MEGKMESVEMAAEAARETAQQGAENPAQKLAKAFKDAVEEIINRELPEKASYRIEGKWVILSVYLSSSERRRLNNQPEKVMRAILARYLNTPFKIKEMPSYIKGHYFKVVALLQEK